MAGQTIGSALEIPQSVLQKMQDAENRLKSIQNAATATAGVISTEFGKMAASTDPFILKLDTIIQKLGLVGSAATNASNATAGFGNKNVGNIQNFTQAIQQAIANINKMSASLQTGGSTGASGVMIARQAVQDLITAMKNVSGMNIAKLREEIGAINNILRDTSYNLTKADQNALVEKKKLLQEELKEQERTANQRAATYAQAIDRMLAAEQSFQNKQKAAYKSNAKEYQAQNYTKNTTYEGALQFSANANTLNRQAKAVEYLTAAKQKLSVQDADYNTKLNALNAAIEKHNAVLSASAAATAHQAQKSSYAQYIKDPNAVLAKSSQAKTLQDSVNAIKDLKAARLQLDTTDKNYQTTLQRLNAAIDSHSKKLRDAGVAARGTSEAMSYLQRYALQLAQRMAVLFSFNAARGFLNNVIDIRGQFEIAERSLEAILQNKPKADEIFNKTVELAIKSPFRIKDLVQYTRQLSAYRIEEDKLYDTTKRLADVSAGLGVDMQRIILAYGQIKATTYLRGGEVRQLTEAGIGIYNELRDYYKSQGKDYTVAQISEMIPKRQVKFEDVEAVFKRMTDKGGTFYKMQEIQAETLQGKINNFKDSLDVMYNSIGKSNEGSIKGAVELATELTNNWEKCVGVAKTLALAILAMNASFLKGTVLGRIFASTIGTSMLALRMNIQTLGTWQGVWATARGAASSAIGAIGTALGALARMLKGMTLFLVIDTIIGYFQKMRAESERLNEIAIDASKMRAGAADLSDEFNAIGKSAGDATDKTAKLREELKGKIGFEPNGNYDLPIPDSTGVAKVAAKQAKAVKEADADTVQAVKDGGEKIKAAVEEREKKQAVAKDTAQVQPKAKGVKEADADTAKAITAGGDTINAALQQRADTIKSATDSLAVAANSIPEALQVPTSKFSKEAKKIYDDLNKALAEVEADFDGFKARKPRKAYWEEAYGAGSKRIREERATIKATAKQLADEWDMAMNYLEAFIDGSFQKSIIPGVDVVDALNSTIRSATPGFTTIRENYIDWLDEMAKMRGETGLFNIPKPFDIQRQLFGFNTDDLGKAAKELKDAYTPEVERLLFEFDHEMAKLEDALGIDTLPESIDGGTGEITAAFDARASEIIKAFPKFDIRSVDFGFTAPTIETTDKETVNAINAGTDAIAAAFYKRKETTDNASGNTQSEHAAKDRDTITASKDTVATKTDTLAVVEAAKQIADTARVTKDSVANAVADTLQTTTKAAKEEAKAIVDASKEEQKATKESAAVIAQKRDVLQRLVNTAKQNGFTMKIDVESIDEAKLNEEFAKAKAAYSDYITYVTIARQRANKMNNNFWTQDIFGIGSIIDGIDENAKDYQNAANDIEVNSYKLEEAIAVVKTQYTASAAETKKYFDVIKAGQKEGEANIDYYKRMYDAIQKLRGGYGGKFTANTDIEKMGLERFKENMDDLYSKFELGRWGDDLQSQAQTFRSDLVNMLGDASEVKNRWGNDPIKIKCVIDDAALAGEWGEASKKLAYRIAEQEYGIKIKEDEKNIKDTAWTIHNQLQRELDSKKINITVDAALSNQLGGYATTQDDLDKALKQARENLKTAQEYQKANRWMLASVLQGGQMDLSDLKTTAGKAVSQNTMVDPVIVQRKLREQIAALEALGAKEESGKKKSGSKAERDILAERIQLLRDMANKYKELLELESKEEALAHTRSYFKEAAQNVGLDIDSFVPDKNTVAKKIRAIANEYKKLNKKGSGLRVAADIEFEVQKESLQKQLEAIKKDVEDYFNKRELHLKLTDVGFDEEQIQKMFGVLPGNWNDIRKSINKRYSEDYGDDKSKWGGDVTKQYEEEMKSLDKKMFDEQVGNLQELTRAYKTQLSDNLQLYVWYLDEKRKLMENEQLAQTPDLQKQYLENLDSQYNKKQQENEWKDFKGTGLYVSVFENLEATSTRILDHMLEKLNGLKGAMGNLDPSELKAITEQMQKIEEVKISRNPFKAFTESLKKLTKARKEYNALGGDKALIQADKDSSKANKAALEQAKVTQEAKNTYNQLLQTKGANDENTKAAGKYYKQQKEVLNEQENIKKKTEEIREEIQKVLAAAQGASANLGNSAAEIGSYISETSGALSSLYSTAKNALDVMDGVGSLITSASSGNVMGVITSVINIVGSVAKAIGDESGIDKAIERLQRQLTALQHSYEKLKNAFDDAWDANSIGRTNDDITKNIEEQIANYESLIAQEKRRKDPDQSQIQEWEIAIDNLKEDAKELQEEMTEALGGFGSEANYKSAAQEFADAWIDAFNDGEDALDALNDKMDEYITNLVKKQAMLRLAKKYLEPAFKAIDAAVDENSDGGLSVTASEMKNISALTGTAAEGLNNAMEQFVEYLGYTSSNSSSLDSLKQGIQGVTESTATALESILNSMRFFLATQQGDVAAIRTLLQGRYGVMDDTSNSTSTPIITELQAQTQYIKAISSSLDSVIKSGHRLGGKGIKVYME